MDQLPTDCVQHPRPGRWRLGRPHHRRQPRSSKPQHAAPRPSPTGSPSTRQLRWGCLTYPSGLTQRISATRRVTFGAACRTTRGRGRPDRARSPQTPAV